jgi:hypothetical protein
MTNTTLSLQKDFNLCMTWLFDAGSSGAMVSSTKKNDERNWVRDVRRKLLGRIEFQITVLTQQYTWTLIPQEHFPHKFDFALLSTTKLTEPIFFLFVEFDRLG